MGFPELVAMVDRAVQKSLGETITYRARFGNPADVPAVFVPRYIRNAFDAVDPGVAEVGPMAFLRLSDLPVDWSPSGDLVTVSGTEYRVRESKQDGQGGISLFLHAV